MPSIWKRIPTATDDKGAQLAQPAAPPPAPEMNAHSLVGGNGQHLVLPMRTGGQPWVGHKGASPQFHPFSPAESFARRAGIGNGGVVMPPPSPLRATVPAVVNSITGQAAGTYQMAPGGGVNSPAAQTSPGKTGR